MGYYFPFLKDVLQEQNLFELEGIKVKAEEEPEEKTIVGSGGEALRPLGMDIVYFLSFFQIKFLYLGVVGQLAP